MTVNLVHSVPKMVDDDNACDEIAAVAVFFVSRKPKNVRESFAGKRRFWVHGVLKCHRAVGEFHRLIQHARAVIRRSNSGVYLDFLTGRVVTMLRGVADQTHLANVPL